MKFSESDVLLQYQGWGKCKIIDMKGLSHMVGQEARIPYKKLPQNYVLLYIGQCNI